MEKEYYDNLQFTVIRKKDGGWLHHFIYEDYRYNRHKVFASGRAQFKCRHKGCKANMIVKFDSRDEAYGPADKEPKIEKMPDVTLHNHVAKTLQYWIKKAREIMRDKCLQRPGRPLAEIYPESMEDIYKLIGDDEAMKKEFGLKMTGFTSMSRYLLRFQDEHLPHLRPKVFHPCGVCGRAFTQLSALYVHKKLHNKKNTPICKVVESSDISFSVRERKDGSLSHIFNIRDYTFCRKQIKESGIVIFKCSVKKCRATIKTKYETKADAYLNKEPVILKMATEEDHEHGVDQMKVLIKKAKRAMHEKIMEDPNKDYNDVYKEALADVQVQIGDIWAKEEFLRQVPSKLRMRRTIDRWRAETRTRLKVKRENPTVSLLDSTPDVNTQAPVSETYFNCTLCSKVFKSDTEFQRHFSDLENKENLCTSQKVENINLNADVDFNSKTNETRIVLVRPNKNKFSNKKTKSGKRTYKRIKQIEDSKEELKLPSDTDSTIQFYTKENKNGRLGHYYLVGDFRFYRHEVDSFGGSRFRCMEKKCGARILAQYKSKEESFRDVQPTLLKITEEHNHGIDQVALWLTRCKDSIRMRMEADPNNSKMRVAYDLCINEILNQIDDDSVKAEFAKKMIKYDMFSRTMSRWRDNARVRTEVKQAVDQPHEEWRPNIDAIKVEYDEELIEPEIGEIDYDNSIAAPNKKSVGVVCIPEIGLLEPKVEPGFAEVEASRVENLDRAKYCLERKKNGKLTPHFIIDGIRYNRNMVKTNGRSRFLCYKKDCYVGFHANYNSYEEAYDGTVEPTLTRIPSVSQHKHSVDHLTVLVKQTKKAMRLKVHEDPTLSCKDAYVSTVQETLNSIVDPAVRQRFETEMTSYKKLVRVIQRWRAESKAKADEWRLTKQTSEISNIQDTIAQAEAIHNQVNLTLLRGTPKVKKHVPSRVIIERVGTSNQPLTQKQILSRAEEISEDVEESLITEVYPEYITGTPNEGVGEHGYSLQGYSIEIMDQEQDGFQNGQLTATVLGKTDILAEASKIVLAPLVHNVANYITICDNSLQGVAEVQHLEADEDTIVEVSEDTIMEVNEDTIVEVDGVVHGVVQQVDGLFDESSMHSNKAEESVVEVDGVTVPVDDVVMQVDGNNSLHEEHVVVYKVMQ